MAKTRPFYRVGEKGVNIVASPLHTPDGGLLSSQNVEFIRDLGVGGIGSRGGMAPLNGTALAGAVMAVANIPLVIPEATTLMAACDTGETETWKSSTNGTTYTDVLTAVARRMASMDKFPATITPAIIPPSQRIAMYQGNLYYPDNDYDIADVVSPYVDNTAAPLTRFNGSSSAIQFRVPNNPAGVGPCRWITDLWVANGVIYFGVWDYGGVDPDSKGRVLSFNPNTSEVTQIGALAWGNGTGENTRGFPFCLTTYLGRLYSIQPGVDVNWTLDKTALASSGYFTSLAEYNGVLYASSTPG